MHLLAGIIAALTGAFYKIDFVDRVENSLDILRLQSGCLRAAMPIRMASITVHCCPQQYDPCATDGFRSAPATYAVKNLQIPGGDPATAVSKPVLRSCKCATFAHLPWTPDPWNGDPRLTQDPVRLLQRVHVESCESLTSQQAMVKKLVSSKEELRGRMQETVPQYAFF